MVERARQLRVPGAVPRELVYSCRHYRREMRALDNALRTLRALSAMGGLPPPLMRRSRRCGVEPWAMSLLCLS